MEQLKHEFPKTNLLMNYWNYQFFYKSFKVAYSFVYRKLFTLISYLAKILLQKPIIIVAMPVAIIRALLSGPANNSFFQTLTPVNKYSSISPWYYDTGCNFKKKKGSQTDLNVRYHCKTTEWFFISSLIINRAMITIHNCFQKLWIWPSCFPPDHRYPRIITQSFNYIVYIGRQKSAISETILKDSY